MNREVIWLTGKTCVGKSVEAERLAKFVNYAVLHTGRACREKFGESDMAESENPVTPDMTEDYVRGLVEECFENLSDGDTLVVDSMPRSVSQVAFIKELADRNQNVRHKIVYCTCSEEERKRRIAQRAQNPDDEKLINARLRHEDGVFVDVLASLATSGMDVKIADLETKTVSTFGGPSSADLESMMDAHLEFVDESFRMQGIQPSLSEMRRMASSKDTAPITQPYVEWTGRFLRQLKKECVEAIDEIPEKWWTIDGADLRACRVEMVDMLHFFFSACMSLGMSAHDVSSLYYKKLEINKARARSGGYSARNKVGKDDEHIGKAKPCEHRSSAWDLRSQCQRCLMCNEQVDV